MKKAYIIFLTICNVLTFFWLTKFPDILMFNLITFFILPLTVIALILGSILLDFYKGQKFTNHIFYKGVIIIFLIVIMLQYKYISAELIVR